MKHYGPVLIFLLLLMAHPIKGAGKGPLEEEVKQTLLTIAKRQAGVVAAKRLVTAQTPDAASRETLSLGSLVEEALRNNPEIRAARYRWEAATTRPAQARALPDPTIGLMYWNQGNPLPGTSVGQNMQAFVEPNFMQEIPFPGKLRLRGAIAAKEADSVGQDLRMTEWRVIGQLKEAYFDLFLTIKSLEIIAQNHGLLTQLTKIAETRYAVGKGTQADVLRSQIELSLLLDRTMVLEQKRDRLAARINSLLNRPTSARLGRPELAKPTPFDFTLDQLLATAEKNSPALRSRALLLDRSSLALTLARKDYLPDFSVSVGYMFFGRFPDMYDVRFNVKVPLYFWRKQRSGVEEAAASLAESKQNFRAAAQDLFFKIKDQYLTVKTAEQLAELYEKGILPQSSAALESALSGYEVGTVDFPGLIDNFAVLLNYQLELYRQRVEREKALARLEELTARPIIR
jgi:outer membrane protein TolC